MPGTIMVGSARIYLARCHAEVGRKPLAHEL